MPSYHYTFRASKHYTPPTANMYRAGHIKDYAVYRRVLEGFNCVSVGCNCMFAKHDPVFAEPDPHLAGHDPHLAMAN